MKSFIVRIDIIVDQPDLLHSVKHFIILTPHTLCRALYARGNKTYFYFFVRKLIPSFHNA